MTAQFLTKMAVTGTANRQLMDAHYFDTPTYSLQKAKIAYRIRREGTQWIATVKGGGSSQGGLHQRQEWNIVVEDQQPDITIFSHTKIGKKLLEIVGDQVLLPILITQFERRTLDVCMPDGSLIEVAADQGAIKAGNKSTPILEVELELKAGKPSSLFTLGATLAKEYALLPETDSKFYRGLLLAGLVTTENKKIPTLPVIAKNQGAEQGLATVVIHLIIEFFAVQQAFFKNQGQPEDLHKLRICLRRLRSLFEFAGAEAVESYKEQQAELRRLGQSLGTLREIDVAYGSWKEWSDCQPANMMSKTSLGRILSHRRVLEGEKTYGLLYGGYATSMLLNLWATLTTDKWLKNVNSQCTMREYTADKFANWLKKMTKQGKKIEWTDREKVHKLRLQVKKLRYVSEVLSTVLDEGEPLRAQLATMQDNLGLLSDIHSTEILLKKLIKGTTSKVLQLEAGMLIGWQGRDALAVQEVMNEDWKKFYKKVQNWGLEQEKSQHR